MLTAIAVLIGVLLGKYFVLNIPFPISPYEPFPHTNIHPSSFIAQLPKLPADISTILDKLPSSPSL